ncbi:MAG: AAA domain-containing protein [Pseudomonadota bacterium]
MTDLVKICPRCGSARPLNEVMCRNDIGGECGFLLVGVPPVHPEAKSPQAPTPVPSLAMPTCPNGHPIEPGDIMCGTCGEIIEEPGPAPTSPDPQESVPEPTVIDGWTVVADISTPNSIRRHFRVEDHNGRTGLLTLYTAEGAEPDPEVYDELQRLSLDHMPEIYATGRHDDHPYDVTEFITGGDLDDLECAPDDVRTLRTIAFEIAKALRDFNRIGLRHRDLRPHAVQVRTREPLDLVISGFGSAQLSDYDLETVAPLEQTRYMAPEAIAGAVSPASDWWSLGVLLLEKVTRGACFEGIGDRAFIIHAIAQGIPLPDDIPDELSTLLRGLLIRDHARRWQWPEFERWYAGEPPTLTVEPDLAETPAGPAIRLGEIECRDPARYAITAARPETWDAARDQLMRGELLGWLDDIGAPTPMRGALRALTARTLDDDVRLSIALKYLNPGIPLVHRGDIVSPTWLTNAPDRAIGYFKDDAPDLVETLERERWLARLKSRDDAIRERARHHEIALDEETLNILQLSTNRAAMAAQWQAKRRLLPDTDEPGLAAVMDRQNPGEEDLVLLLAADPGQFRPLEDVLGQAQKLASDVNLPAFDADTARHQVQDNGRLALMRLLDERTAEFARCGNHRVDSWVDEFRVRHRMSLPQALVTLAVPEEAWEVPKSQAFVQQVISFFEQKVSHTITRGPLARMAISRSSDKIDLAELGTPDVPAQAMLTKVLHRDGSRVRIDPQTFIDEPALEGRLQRLQRRTSLYRRDTGIDGLYLGFPFLLFTPSGSTMKTRIAPILLWPINIEGSPGRRDLHEIRFDTDRDEVKLNPALESILGPGDFQKWRKRLADLLGGSLDLDNVLAAFASPTLPIAEDKLAPLPPADTSTPRGTGRLSCSAVLFHATYMAQSIVEDLRQLRTRPPDDTALAAFLRLEEGGTVESARVTEIDRYFTIDSDPSQEEAILAARCGPGLVIEGPPGTGKSQTIVNLVGDAVGRGKTIAVVCQKQAALEVVRKRLDAEGLSGRLIFVNDENKDRRTILQDIRDQLAGLGQLGARRTLQTDRTATAKRIERLEREIDAYHQALHTHDEQAGATYREMIGELVDAEDGLVLTPSGHRLQTALAHRDRLAVDMLSQEVCGVAADWLVADYEGSSLAALKPFGWGAAELGAFTEAFDALTAAEADRLHHMAEHPLAFTCTDPKGLCDWLTRHGQEIADLTGPMAADLRAWKGIFAGGDSEVSAGDELIAAVISVGDRLSTLPERPSAEDGMHSLLQPMSEGELRDWIDTSAMASADVGLFGRLSFARWGARRRLRKLLNEHRLSPDDPGMRAFHGATRLENDLRPIRRLLERVAKALAMDDDGPRIAAANRKDLIAVADQFRGRLETVSALISTLSECPVPKVAIRAGGNAEGWQQFLDDSAEVIERHTLGGASLGMLNQLEEWLQSDWLEARKADILEDRDTTPAILDIRGRYEQIPAYQKFRSRSRNLGAEAFDILALLRPISDQLQPLDQDELPDQITRLLRQQARLAWKSRIESATPELLVDRSSLKAKIGDLARCDDEMRHLNSEHLRTSYMDRKHVRINFQTGRMAAQRDWDAITRLQGPRALRLREFINRGVDLGLMELRPIWLMNPDTASRLFPLEAALFDIVVYDEASQMPVEYALPTLYRGRTVVVSGDEKQLPPTSFFHSKVESDEAEMLEGALPNEDISEEERDELETAWNRREIKDCPDLLALGRSSVPVQTLKVHYRSAYRELIEFSNHAFYEASLAVPARHPDALIREARPIELHQIDGLYDEQSNRDEAKAVLDIVADYWSRPEPPSIGVVTFNRKQADLIDDVFAARAAEDPGFAAWLTRESARSERGEDIGFFVKNVENVQGDERDIIIFSTTFGTNRAGAFRRFFGVLGQSGGERRLNVAVTRARRKVVITTSMPIAEISDIVAGRERPSRPRDYLQAYLHYAALVSDGRLEEQRDMLRVFRKSRQQTDDRAGGGRRDGFIDAIGREIEALGYHADRADDGTAFGVDFAIRHPDHGLYGIGIECDAPCNPILATARAREIWRPQVLKMAVPHVHRVHSRDWYQDRADERRRLATAIETALASNGTGTEGMTP